MKSFLYLVTSLMLSCWKISAFSILLFLRMHFFPGRFSRTRMRGERASTTPLDIIHAAAADDDDGTAHASLRSIVALNGSLVLMSTLKERLIQCRDGFHDSFDHNRHAGCHKPMPNSTPLKALMLTMLAAILESRLPSFFLRKPFFRSQRLAAHDLAPMLEVIYLWILKKA